MHRVEALEAAIATFAIQQTLARYAHAIDRCDAALLDGVWARDAIVDYGSGAIDALVSTSAELLERVGSRFSTQLESEASKLDHAAANVTASAVEMASLGDAFGAAFAVSWLESRDQYRALRLAAAAGAITVTREGAQSSLPYRKEVEEFLQKQNPVAP